MKAVILAGGLGTRLSEETDLKPKPTISVKKALEYILNSKYTGELYVLDFKSERVEGYINQRKEMVNLQNNKETF